MKCELSDGTGCFFRVDESGSCGRSPAVASKCPPLVEGRWAATASATQAEDVSENLKVDLALNCYSSRIHNVDEVESLKDLPFFKTRNSYNM